MPNLTVVYLSTAVLAACVLATARVHDADANAFTFRHQLNQHNHVLPWHVVPLQLVDLHKLETTSLKRYRRVFQLGEVDAAAPKSDLLTAVQRHFTTQVCADSENASGRRSS